MLSVAERIIHTLPTWSYNIILIFVVENLT